ncbi:hypothetical protein LKO27_14905 [Tessaracoccus sp. OS52]|uniref:ATP-grasp domain-containing protein n=1 Tax=Tessaracoccus sp. OS52 TaxID=2886691 RepID=UPI001D11F3A1|nr:hypothetical protein [Tessaracoccus sp. OS52]MCC2594690.1 hypothetical protein [Tessaracoccus sp. OS52]
MIVLAGLRDDPPLEAAHTAAQGLGLDVAFVDLGGPGARLRGTVLESQGTEVDLDDATGLYLRGHGAADPYLVACLRDWAERAPSTVRVVNRRAGAATNASKPAQGLLIARAGFEVPTGLLTTDPAAAHAFALRHGKVIVKSTSAVRSIVRLVRADEDFSAVEWCPTQFQAWVPGVEFRVHVVGDSVFTHRVLSDDVDYRYGSAAVTPDELPADVEARSWRLTSELGLELAGLDLRRTPEGRWFCFEANTSPVWSAYDADGAIADALARRLAAVA